MLAAYIATLRGWMQAYRRWPNTISGQTGAIYLSTIGRVTSFRAISATVATCAVPHGRSTGMASKGSFFETGPNGREQLATYRLDPVSAPARAGPRHPPRHQRCADATAWLCIPCRPLCAGARRCSFWSSSLLARRITARISAMTDVAEAIAI